jgi:hypothetical protein
MKKSLITLIALSFAFLAGSAGAAQHEKPAAKEDPIAAACKGKKAGEMVKVDGKDVKCPKKTKKKSANKKGAVPATPVQPAAPATK